MSHSRLAIYETLCSHWSGDEKTPPPRQHQAGISPTKEAFPVDLWLPLGSEEKGGLQSFQKENSQGLVNPKSLPSKAKPASYSAGKLPGAGSLARRCRAAIPQSAWLAMALSHRLGNGTAPLRLKAPLPASLVDLGSVPGGCSRI